jgi:outer membrane lipoprotein carrier protein
MGLIKLSVFIFLTYGVALAGELSCPSLSPTSPGLLEGIEERYRKVSSLEARFLQTSYFVGLDKRENSQGSVYFLKPAKMNWNYEVPDPQRFISNGETIWFYQPKLNQVTLTDFTNSFSSDIPVTFLLGIGSLKESFEARGTCKAEGGVIVELTPKKSDASLSHFLLLVNEKELTPLGAKVIDLGGNETTIRLLSPAFDRQLPVSQFSFEIPKGVDVIDNRSGGRKAPAQVSEENL